MGTEVRVNELPVCSFCMNEAEYDFVMYTGQWAYGCKFHWMILRATAELGTGRGQKLVLTGSQKEDI